MITATTRLYLRTISPTDRDAFFRIYSDKEAMQHRGNAPLETLEDADRMIAKTLRDYGSNGECRLAIVETASDQPIGSFLYKTLSETSCEIGYSIGREYWGRGYGLEAVQAMQAYLRQMGYHVLLATTKTENIASSRLLQKAGFDLVSEDKATGQLWFELDL